MAILGEVFWFDGLGELGVKLAEQLRRGAILGFVVSVWYFTEKCVAVLGASPAHIWFGSLNTEIFEENSYGL
jgi:hypothetical protein